MTSCKLAPEQAYQAIEHLAKEAHVVAGLISALNFLPSDDYRNVLETCASLASKVHQDLTRLVGDAA